MIIKDIVLTIVTPEHHHYLSYSNGNEGNIFRISDTNFNAVHSSVNLNDLLPISVPALNFDKIAAFQIHLGDIPYKCKYSDRFGKLEMFEATDIYKILEKYYV